MSCGQMEGAPSISATPQGTVLNSLHLSFGASVRAISTRKIHEPARRILYWLGNQGQYRIRRAGILYWLGNQGRSGHRQNGAQGRRRFADASVARADHPRSFATYDWRE